MTAPVGEGPAGRDRLGVALLLPAPVGEEVDGLRRAVGDASLGRVAAHITLVPPVNVRRDRLGEALATLRRAAAAGPRRLALTVGPVATFAPVNPVLYLAVSGEGLAPLAALRDRVFSGAWERRLSWPFVPHVTLADQLDPDRMAAALACLDHYRAEVVVDTVHVLQEVDRGAARRWVPVADAAFGPPVLIGRGGLPLELTASRGLDPEAAALVSRWLGPGPSGSPDTGSGGVEGFARAVGEGREWLAALAETGPAGTRSRSPIVVTARREGAVAGVAAARLTEDGAAVGVLVDPAVRRQGIGSHLLAAVEGAVTDAGWASARLAASGPAAFYRARSGWSVAGGQANVIDE